MTERYQETLPGLSDRDILEAMTPDGIVDHIIGMGEQATELETKMNLASIVLEGAYGITVEDVLKRREIQNGERT